MKAINNISKNHIISNAFLRSHCDMNLPGMPAMQFLKSWLFFTYFAYNSRSGT